VVVYKADRLGRGRLDLARLIEAFDKHRVSFVRPVNFPPFRVTNPGEP
jgi:DNA invertase Pin-like site-specific DNA recombinase